MPIKHVILFIFFAFGGHYSIAKENVFVSLFEGQLIGESVQYLEDETKLMDLNQVIELYKEGKFTPSQKTVFARPASISNYWFTFSIKAQANESDLWMKIGNHGMEYVDFYLFNEKEILIDSLHTGGYLPFETRQKESYSYWFNLFQKQENGKRTVFIKVNSAGMMDVPIFVGTTEILEAQEKKNVYYSIFFLGALIIMMVYNLSLWVFTRDRVYGYYSGYILFSIFATTFLNNFPVLIDLFGGYTTYRYGMLFIVPLGVFTGLFIIDFLKLNEKSKKLALFIKIQIIAAGVLGGCNVFFTVVYLANPLQILTVILLLSCLFTGYYQWYKGDHRARYYALGWTINLSAIILTLGTMNGIFEYNQLLRNSMYFGVLLELTIFSIALANRLNELRKEQIDLNVKLEKLNGSLIESNASLDAFNYHVSHDLKTVLNNSNVLTKMIKKYNKKENPAKVEEVTNKLLKVTEIGTETVHSFLQLASVNNLAKSQRLEFLSVTEEIDLVLEYNGLEKQIEVNITNPGVAYILIHKKAFHSIFQNFFTNTIKFNKRKPIANIKFSLNNNEVEIVYRDNGIGIDLEENKELIFAPFERVVNELNTEGSGVGLYLVKRMIENYGGQISVKSSLGDGVEFRITIPQLEPITK